MVLLKRIFRVRLLNSIHLENESCGENGSNKDRVSLEYSVVDRSCELSKSILEIEILTEYSTYPGHLRLSPIGVTSRYKDVS